MDTEILKRLGFTESTDDHHGSSFHALRLKGFDIQVWTRQEYVDEILVFGFGENCNGRYWFPENVEIPDAVVFVLRRHLNDLTELNDSLRDELIGRDVPDFTVVRNSGTFICIKSVFIVRNIG